MVDSLRDKFKVAVQQGAQVKRGTTERRHKDRIFEDVIYPFTVGEDARLFNRAEDQDIRHEAMRSAK